MDHPNNATISGSFNSTQPVSGQTLFWAVTGLALGAMSQSSIVADHFLDDRDDAEAKFVPYASSPFHCLIDAIFEAVVISRYLLKITGIWKSPSDMSSETEQPHTESPTRQLVSSRAILLGFTILPLSIKVFGMRGIPITQAIVACFLATILTRFICTLIGQRLRAEEHVVYAYRRYIAEDKSQFEARALTVHFLLCSFVWIHINRNLVTVRTDILASLLRLSYYPTLILPLMFWLHILWCLLILFNQWKLLRLWILPLSPMAIILPFMFARAHIQLMVDGDYSPTDTMTLYRIFSMMWSIADLSYLLGGILTLVAGRIADGQEVDDIEHHRQSAQVMGAEGTDPTTGLFQDSRKLNDTEHEQLLAQIIGIEASVLATGPSQDSHECHLYLSSTSSNTTSDPPSQTDLVDHEDHVMPSFGPDRKDRPQSLRSHPLCYYGYRFRLWLWFSWVFRGFRRSTTQALRTTWAGLSEAEKSRSFLQRLGRSLKLFSWISLCFTVQLVIFLIFTFLNIIDYSVLFNWVGVIRTRYKDTVLWMSFAIFNLVTAATYYLVAFDGAQTSNPGWTSWLGR